MAITEVNTPQSRCHLALAWADITPPVGIYHRMWGAAKHERATGVHRPLRATVAVFVPIECGASGSLSPSGGEGQGEGAIHHSYPPKDEKRPSSPLPPPPSQAVGRPAPGPAPSPLGRR